MHDKSLTSSVEEGALPSFRQMSTLALEKIESDLRLLVDIRKKDEEWDEADVNVELSLDLALGEVQRMKQERFAGDAEFSTRWFTATSAICLASEVFSRSGSSFYGRVLSRAARDCELLAELCEFVEAPLP